MASAGLFEVLKRIGVREGELPALVPALDVPALVYQCARHGLSAYAGDAFARAKVTLPPLEQQALSDDARLTVMQAVKNKRLLFAVLDAFQKKGLTPIVLKGFGLASRLYDAPLARPSTDIDVLVKPHELPAAHEALETLGLAQMRDPALGDVHEEHHHEAFEGPAGLVEVHFRLFAGFGMATYDDAAVQQRAAPAHLEGRTVRFLNAQDEFLYLAVHAANHAFLRASWLVDLHRFVRQVPALDFSKVAQLARDAGFTAPYAAALDALQTAFGHETISTHARALAGHERLRHLVNAKVFSAENLAAAQFAEGTVAPFLIRVWLTDSPARVGQQVSFGVKRWLRRNVRRAF